MGSVSVSEDEKADKVGSTMAILQLNDKKAEESDKNVKSETNKPLSRLGEMLAKKGGKNDLTPVNQAESSRRGSVTSNVSKVPPSQIERQYQAPNSLDLFALETRSRRTIGELIRPIIADLDSDRRKVAEINSKQDRINFRLGQLEYTLGLNDSKPQIFEDIENKVAEVRSDLAISESESKFRFNICDQRIEALERDLKNMTADMKQLDGLMKMRDLETTRANQQVAEIRQSIKSEFARVENIVSNVDFRLANTMQTYDSKVNDTNSKIINFEQKISEMQSFVKHSYDQSTQNRLQIQKLGSMKVEQKVFDETTENLRTQIETIRFATYDNFRVIRATDNFVEKYLPFQIQELISKNLLSFLHKPISDDQILNGLKDQLTPDQAKE